MDIESKGSNKRVFHRLGKRQSHQNQQKQKVCFHWQAGRCTRTPCAFLHRELPLPPPPSTHHPPSSSSTFFNASAKRPHGLGGGGSRNDGGGGVPPKKMERVCNYWVQGNCNYGDNCKFLHSWSIGGSISLEGHQKVVTGITLPSEDKLYTGSKDENERISDCASEQAAQNGGVLPTAGELYQRTHMKVVPGKGKVPCSDNSKQIKDTYEKNLDECLEKNIDKDPNHIYYETVGGRKKRMVPDLGRNADLYYERASRRSSSSSSSYTPSILSQLLTRLEDSQRQMFQRNAELERSRMELESKRMELESKRIQLERERLQFEGKRLQMQKEREEEIIKRNADYILLMKRIIDLYAQMFSKCSGDLRDPSSGGKSLMP